MYKRINITLPDDVLGRADDFAESERYSRSGLIATALEAFIDRAGAAGDVVREQRAAYAPAAPATGSSQASATVRSSAMATLDEVAPLLHAFFAARDDVEAAWVFGSVARGDATLVSDIDIAVLPKVGMDAASRRESAFDLTGRLSSVLGRDDVDLACLPDVSVQMAHRVVVEGTVVYEESGARLAEVEIAVIRAFADFEPVIREAKRVLRERTEDYARS